MYPVCEQCQNISQEKSLLDDWISDRMSNTLLMDDIMNMTHNNTQVIDMSFTNISIDRSFNREFENYNIARLVIYLLVLPILGVFGIVGNILSIVVLGRDDVMKKTTRFLLRNLAMADIGFLIMFVFQNACRTIINLKIITTIYQLPHYSSPQMDQLFSSMEPYLWLIRHVLHVTSIYSVVLVTGDRYIAICRPLQSGRLSTTQNARWAVVVVWCMAVIVNIPRGIEYMTIPCNNATTWCHESSMPLHHDGVHILVYHFILDNIVKMIIPLTALITFNIKLIKAVRASREMHSETHQQQKNTTVMLVTIVITFIICFTPRLLKGVLRVIDYFKNGNIDNYWMYNSMLSNMFLTVNSAVNFLIYLARGERFRRILKNICLPTRLQ